MHQVWPEHSSTGRHPVSPAQTGAQLQHLVQNVDGCLDFQALRDALVVAVFQGVKDMKEAVQGMQLAAATVSQARQLLQPGTDIVLHTNWTTRFFGDLE